MLKHGSTYNVIIDGFDFYVSLRLHVLKSTDLVNWTGGGNNGLLPAGQAGDGPTTRPDGTAPSVAHFPDNPAGERFVLYYTGVHKQTGKPCVGVVTAEAPEGPVHRP